MQENRSEKTAGRRAAAASKSLTYCLRRASAVGSMFFLGFAAPRAVAQGTLHGQAPISTDTLKLTLAQARVLAVRANPDLHTTRLDIAIARGELRQAGLPIRSNPEADVLTRGSGTALGISQEFEIAGQRGARRNAARAGVERSSAAVTNVARTMIGAVDRAFYLFVASDQRTLLAGEVLDLSQRLAEMSHRMLDAGEISKLDYNLAAVEFGRSRARTLEAQREREEVISDLRRLLGLNPKAPILAVIDSAADIHLDVDSLVALALGRRPDLAERTAALRAADAQVSVAHREAMPNLVVRLSSEIVESSGARELRPGLGFTLPAFNRNQGEVQARQAAALQAELAVISLRTHVRSEVSSAVARYRTASEETDVLQSTVLVPARQNRALLETAYRERKVGLPVLLLIRNQVIGAEMEYWDAWLAKHLALADLAEATGETVVGFNPRPVP